MITFSLPTISFICQDIPRDILQNVSFGYVTDVRGALHLPIRELEGLQLRKFE